MKNIRDRNEDGWTSLFMTDDGTDNRMIFVRENRRTENLASSAAARIIFKREYMCLHVAIK